MLFRGRVVSLQSYILTENIVFIVLPLKLLATFSDLFEHYFNPKQMSHSGIHRSTYIKLFNIFESNLNLNDYLRTD